MVKLGKFFYRWRGVIGFIAFWLTFFLSRPNAKTTFLTLPITLIGLLVRFWAGGYIGKTARSYELDGEVIVESGPYRFLRNPLYLGNFFLTFGVLLALNPPVFYQVLVIILFWIYYGIIIKSEQNYLEQKFGERYRLYCKTVSAILPSFRQKKFLAKDQKFDFRTAQREFQTIVIVLLIYGLIYLKAVRKI
ncbi:MAG: isoprenylcysteine carboxylmethyltransferase family protein [candidate division WOR-3 bacterium]